MKGGVKWARLMPKLRSGASGRPGPSRQGTLSCTPLHRWHSRGSPRPRPEVGGGGLGAAATWPVSQTLRGGTGWEPCRGVLPTSQAPTAGPLLMVGFLGLSAPSPTLLVSLKHSFLPGVCCLLIHPRWLASGAGSAHQSSHPLLGPPPGRATLAPCPHEASPEGAF